MRGVIAIGDGVWYGYRKKQLNRKEAGNMIDLAQSVVLLIDVQEKLVRAMDSEAVVSNAVRVMKACQLLRVPVIVTEQNPAGLGATVSAVAGALPAGTVVEAKTCFSALAEPRIAEALQKVGRRQVVIGGIEAHICVFQTAWALREAGYDVWIMADVCASRSVTDTETALVALRDIGCRVVGHETVLFAWLRDAAHPQFKAIQGLVKKK